MLGPQERAQLCAAQIEEHIRQAVLPTETSWNLLIKFLIDEVDGVYVQAAGETVLVPSAELAAVPMKDWALMAKTRRGAITLVPEPEAPAAEPEPEPEVAETG